MYGDKCIQNSVHERPRRRWQDIKTNLRKEVLWKNVDYTGWYRTEFSGSEAGSYVLTV
jgi:hypothetical protein